MMQNLGLLLLAFITTAFSWAPTPHLVPRASIDASSNGPIDQPADERIARSSYNVSQANIANSLSVLPTYPVDCFGPESPFALHIAVAADCEFVINEMILRLPNPMQKQKFGFNDSADLNLHAPENRNWFHGGCVICLSSQDETEEDTFRPVDVAMVAQRIVQECVIGSKVALGGTASIGSILKDFYIVIGGLPPPPLSSSNDTLSLNPSVALHNIVPEGHITFKESDTRNLANRSRNPIDRISSGNLNPAISCVKPGMPAAAGDINVDDCSATARTILQDPQVLKPQLFTTEKTGGIHVPFLRKAGSCYLLVNTYAPYSTSDMFSLLKAVYYASEVMRKCSLGGVAKISRETGFFVSVTGVNPMPMEKGLANLLNSTTSSPGLETY